MGQASGGRFLALPRADSGSFGFTDRAHTPRSIACALPHIGSDFERAPGWVLLTTRGRKTGIPREVLRSIPARDTDMIREIAGRARHGHAKKPILLNTLRCNRLLRFSIQHDIDRARVGAKDSDLQIVASSVGTQDAEWISMSTGNEAAHVVTRQASNLESFRLHL